MTTFLLIVWMLFSIPTALLAHRKNLSVSAWSCVGLIFGALGLIFVMAMPPVTASPRWHWHSGAGGSGNNLSVGGF
jgi:hypothetical protein